MYLSLKAGNIHESEGYIGRQGSCILALKQAKYMILLVVQPDDSQGTHAIPTQQKNRAHRRGSS